MFGSDIVDVALGMIFTYLLLSLICSALNELIEGRLKNRATDLENGLRELLNDPDGTTLVKKVYEHGMINGLFKGNYDPVAADKTNLPSYIPSRSFALAIFGLLVPDRSATNSTASFRDAIAQIGNTKVKDALVTMLNISGDDVDKFRENVENWFNSTMDRVSGWYKRRSQMIVFVLGFVLAMAMNVNSISIANDLWVHKAQRNAMISATQGYLANRPQKEGQIGVDGGLKANIEAFQSYGLPIGWKISRGHDVKWWVGFGVVSLLGWLITACAVSLGAPFWFDMLNKLVVVRSTIKPHEKSLEEPSKS
ncbi:MAG: hypothetical protein JWN74_1239 [Acidobacteriaceae bacterium]|nr:hypothetical protein [Acidobacteriaceae bacterium]